MVHVKDCHFWQAYNVHIQVPRLGELGYGLIAIHLPKLYQMALMPFLMDGNNHWYLAV